MLRCFKTGYGQLALAIAAALAVYFVGWHGEHLAALLPFAVILLCPLAHLLLHRHGAHDHSQREDSHR